MSTYPALANQDASRLPCGALEKWVFSTDRRDLLSSKLLSDKDDTKGNAEDDTKQSSPKKTLFVAGSEDEFYYTMLQIDNEIQTESLKPTDERNTDALSQLQTEFDSYVDKVNDKWDETKRYVRIPSRLKDSIFRNACRQLTSDDTEIRTKSIKTIEDRISPTYDYSRPSDPSQGVYSQTAETRTHKEYITAEALQTKLDTKMESSLTGHNSKNITRNYKVTALHYLMKAQLSLEQKQNILSNFYNRLFIGDNEDTVMEWIMQDLNDEKYKYPRFGFRPVHSQLTLAQMQTLRQNKPDLLRVSGFIEAYLKKLMPLELGIYIGKNWEKDIPLRMKWKFMRTLYGYANGTDLQNSDYKSSNSIRSYIYYQYMIFIERNYYLLGKQSLSGTTDKGDMIETKDSETKSAESETVQREGLFDCAYDLEAIIKYILIPKAVSYNTLFRDSYYKENNKQNWGGDTCMAYTYSYSFLAQFPGVPNFSNREDNAFFERFFEYLFTEEGMQYWTDFVANKENISDVSVKKFLIDASADSASIVKTFSQYIDGRFIERMRLQSLINNAMELDKLDENIKKLKELHGGQYVSNLKEEILIAFDKFKNAKSYNLGEKIDIFVNVKNVNDLTVKFFEINTKSYYRDKEAQIETDMNLDGLNAKIEQVITNKAIGIKNSYHKKQICIPFPSELSNKRGVYFVDLLSNGRHSRSVIKIGDIRYLTRVTSAGHLFQLLDETNQVIEGSIFMSGHLYQSDSKQQIFIPFTTRPKSAQQIILQRNDDATFNVLTVFSHQSETYSLQCGIYVDREQLLEKKRATIVVRGGLFLNNHRVGLDQLLENVKLSVTLQTGDGVDVEKTFSNFSLYDEKESVATFTVPNEPRSIAIRLDGEVKNMSQNSKQSVSKSVRFSINSIDTSSNIGQMFLIPSVDSSYIIALYGKNGEGIANKDIELTLDSLYSKSSIQFSLTTDELGRVYLPRGMTASYIRLRAHCRSVNSIRCDWDLNNGINVCDTPNIINMTTNARVCIPYLPKLKSEEIGFGLFDKYYIKSYSDALVYEPDKGYITLSNLPAGDFVLKCLDLDYDIRIYVTERGKVSADERYNVNTNEIVELSPKQPLQISEITNDQKENVLQIQLNGVNDRTRVHIFATHMISRFSLSQYLNAINPSALSKKFITQSTCKYLPSRMIGEELRYILEREKAKKYIGNSLIRPSFLIKPLEHKSTTNKTQTAKKGGRIQKESVGGGTAWEDAMARHKISACALSQQSPNDDRYNIEFIGATAVFIANQKPDVSTGVLNVNMSALNTNQRFVRIIAFDEENCVIRGLALGNDNLDGSVKEYESPVFEYSDNRMNPGLNPKYQYVDERNIVLLSEKNESYVFDDFKTAQIETYQSFTDIFNLIQTVSNNHELKVKWSFLTQWETMKLKEKLKKYDEFFCHELHLFLKKKDNTFFNAVCVPLIASKLNKDFMDYYLLNDRQQLRKYCKLNRLKALNPLEQILLAQMFKKEEPKLCKSLLAFFKSKQESFEIDPQTFDRLFRTALATKAMDDSKTIQDNINESKVWAEEEEEEEDEDDDDSDYAEQECAIVSSMAMDGGMGGMMAQSMSRSAHSMGGMMAKSARRSAPMRGLTGMSGMKSKGFMATAQNESLSIRPQPQRFGGHSKQRQEMQQQQLFKQVEQTKEYQETYYYKILFEQNTQNLIPLNKFWSSFGEQMLSTEDSVCNQAFLSKYLLFATSSLNEILCVLSVIDMPFNSENISPDFKFGENGINDRSVRLIAQSPTILFAKELKKQDRGDSDSEEEQKEASDESEESVKPQSISINVVYFDPNHRYQTDENGQRMDKFVNKYDMRCGKIYGCLSILTNVSSIRQSIEILCQIPTGAIPVNGGFRTKTNFITVNAYSVHKFEFYFYFPQNCAKGKAFRQYPIVVTKKNKIIGTSKKSKDDKCKIKVKNADENQKLDIKSWADVSLNGTNEDILHYLQSHNLNKIDLTRVYYKLNKDQKFYDALVRLLNGQNYYDSNVWGINLFYYKKAMDGDNEDGKDEINQRFAIVQEYLLMSAAFKSGLAPYFESTAFEYDDLQNNKYSYLEYIPLVNARAHLLGQKREILNDAFKTQYQSCLQRCMYRSTSVLDLPCTDILSLLYYLLLQDRIEEALDVYRIINDNGALRQEIERRVPVCFDYFKAYMALFVDDDSDEKGIDNAMSIAQEIQTKYKDSVLISSKKRLFEDIAVLLSDLSEYKREDASDKDSAVHGIGDRDRAMQRLADKTPSLDFEIRKSERKLMITTANLSRVTVNFYTMNTEILFSNSPFFKDESSKEANNKSAFAYIAPNMSANVEIEMDSKEESAESQLQKKTEFAIPNELKNTNLFIQVISSTVNVSKPFYDHELSVLVKESYGQLRVLVPSHKNENKLVPLKKAYVKVYSRTNGGQNQFYKDGYTDIRGKFDYASISTDQLNKTKKFGIFVKAPGYGSIIKEAKPPKQ